MGSSQKWLSNPQNLFICLCTYSALGTYKMQGSGPDSKASKTNKVMMANLSLSRLQTSVMGHSSQHLRPCSACTVRPVLFIDDVTSFSAQRCRVSVTIGEGDVNNAAGGSKWRGKGLNSAQPLALPLLPLSSSIEIRVSSL